MLQVFEKLRQAVGSITFELSDGSEEECIWFGLLKFVRRGDNVVVRDMEYADVGMSARVVSGDKYLRLIEKIVVSAPIEELRKGKNERFFHKRIRGVCRFGENLHSQLTEQDKRTIKAELMVMSPKEVAARWNLSEWYCKTILYDKSESWNKL